MQCKSHIFISLFFLLLVPLLNCCSKTSYDIAYDNNARKVSISKNDGKKIMMPDSGVYEGEYKDGLFHGKGTLVWRNGSVYKGDFKNGLFHGNARLIYANGNVYEGGFADGMEEGAGHYVMVNGNEYTGDFSGGVFQGKGRYKEKDGNIYEGDFKKGALSGLGKIIYTDVGEYTGEVNNWKMHGKGVYQVNNNGTKYKGDFVNDELSGYAEVIFKSGDQYTGQVDGWRGNGRGEMKKKNGEVYKGEFKSGLYHGSGKIIYKNKSSYKGSFESGMRHGMGVYVRANPKGHKKELEGWWQYDRYMGKKKPVEILNAKKQKKKQINAEKIFYDQPLLLDHALKQLKPTTKQVPDLYMVNFAAYGSQDVFMKEAHFAKNLFDTSFGTQGRSLSLINNHKENSNTPLASVTNLKRSIKYVAKIMDKEEDILFLYLTSHGSKKHVLSVTLEKMPLNDLPVKKLAEILKESEIKWKVIVVSSCYSGGFIKELKDEYTMVITASKADHVSFGCDDEADLTFFGRAFFKKSLPHSATFKSAFEEARTHISQWEDDEKYDHSEPQIWTTDKIEQHLALWKKNLSNKLAFKKETGSPQLDKPGNIYKVIH